MLLLAAIRTQDVAAVSQKTTSEQRRATLVACETGSVPVAAFKCDELGTVNSSYRLITHGALVGVQLTVALDTAWSVVDHCKPLASKYALAVRAHEAVAVP